MLTTGTSTWASATISIRRILRRYLLHSYVSLNTHESLWCTWRLQPINYRCETGLFPMSASSVTTSRTPADSLSNSETEVKEKPVWKFNLGLNNSVCHNIMKGVTAEYQFMLSNEFCQAKLDYRTYELEAEPGVNGYLFHYGVLLRSKSTAEAGGNWKPFYIACNDFKPQLQLAVVLLHLIILHLRNDLLDRQSIWNILKKLTIYGKGDQILLIDIMNSSQLAVCRPMSRHKSIVAFPLRCHFKTYRTFFIFTVLLPSQAIFISKIIPGAAAEKDGELRVGHGFVG